MLVVQQELDDAEIGKGFMVNLLQCLSMRFSQPVQSFLATVERTCKGVGPFRPALLAVVVPQDVVKSVTLQPIGVFCTVVRVVTPEFLRCGLTKNPTGVYRKAATDLAGCLPANMRICRRRWVLDSC